MNKMINEHFYGWGTTYYHDILRDIDPLFSDVEDYPERMMDYWEGQAKAYREEGNCERASECASAVRYAKELYYGKFADRIMTTKQKESSKKRQNEFYESLAETVITDEQRRLSRLRESIYEQNDKPKL